MDMVTRSRDGCRVAVCGAARRDADGLRRERVESFYETLKSAMQIAMKSHVPFKRYFSLRLRRRSSALNICARAGAST